MTTRPSAEAASHQPPAGQLDPAEIIQDLATWQLEPLEGASGTIGPDETGPEANQRHAILELSGAGGVVLRPADPPAVPLDSWGAQLWVQVPEPFAPEHTPELVLLFANGTECSMGRLDFVGWHLLHRRLLGSAGGSLVGVEIRHLFIPESQTLTISSLGFEAASPPALTADATPDCDAYDAPLSMQPALQEEVNNSIQKDGISFVLEARSLSSVVRYVYTPIEGNLSDIEVELNSAEPIKVSEDGGVTVEMQQRDWSAADDEVERHFVSCEQVGSWVEARWQWKRGDEFADFLYRIGIQGKSLIVELEGGNGKATGVDLGYVSGAVHPRFIQIPYLNFGDQHPQILCTAGLFVSGYLDWYSSSATSLYGAAVQDAQPTRLNGGCRYASMSDGRRRMLHERWVLTVSRQFEEVIPQVPTPGSARQLESLKHLVWSQLGPLEPSEEAYVEAYEQLRLYRQLGLTDLLLLHPDDIWRDSAQGGAALGRDGDPAKGGDDALSECLEAVEDLGFACALPSSFRSISTADDEWDTDQAMRQADGNMAISRPGWYALKPSRAPSIAAEHIAAASGKYGNRYSFLTTHAWTPPWEHVDCDHRLRDPASFGATLRSEQALLAGLAHLPGATPEDGADDGGTAQVVGEGGNHWLYAGLLPAHLAPIRGPNPSRQPLLVDFDLRVLHPVEMDAGVGSPDQFLGADLPEDERHSRSESLCRYLAATVAFGHAGLLPDLADWGLPAVVKSYYMLRHLQPHYLGSPVESVLYHHDGNLLEVSEALMSGAYEKSQVQVTYQSGLRVFVNGGWTDDWPVEHDGTVYTLNPASFLAYSPDGLLVYSADTGNGRIDLARSSEGLYCDARDTQVELGSVKVSGAALVRHENWEIDIFPIEGCDTIEVTPGQIWPDRRMPPLQILAYRPDDESPVVKASQVTDPVIAIRPEDDYYRYTITLPEWMVEPGR